MIIDYLYETKISCSTYNANIDQTGITVTVELLDFNKKQVNGEVVLGCDKGKFTDVSTGTGATVTDKKVTATTVNGKIVATWTASDWGLTTFSANNSKIQCHVSGWKNITSLLRLNTAYEVELLVNDTLKLAKLTYSRKNWSVNKNTSSTSTINIPKPYVPRGYHTQTYTKNIYLKLHFNTDDKVGVIECINDTSSDVNVSCYCDFIYSY